MTQRPIKNQVNESDELQSAQSEINRSLRNIHRIGLSQRDKLIYKLHTEQDIPLERFAEILGVTRERIRQIIHKYQVGGVQ